MPVLAGRLVIFSFSFENLNLQAKFYLKSLFSKFTGKTKKKVTKCRDRIIEDDSVRSEKEAKQSQVTFKKIQR